jgi:ATP/maltotriose-dependent transcriptional regulator MalT
VQGRLDGVEEAAGRAYAAATASYAAAVPSWGLADLHVTVLRLAGLLSAAEDVAAAWHRRAATVPGPMQRPAGLSLVGQAAAFQGRLDTAIRLLRESLAGMGAVGAQAPNYRALIALTQALAMAGRVVDARQAWAELQRTRHPSLRLVDPDLALTRAWLVAAEGAVSEAVALAREAADLAASRDQAAYEVLAAQTAARFGDRGVAGRLARLVGRVDGPRAAAAEAHAAALAADDGAGLQAASRALEDMGDLGAAADAAAHAAAAHDRAGRRGTARAEVVRAHRLAEAGGGACTPALAAIDRPLPLTDREREIVTLAARGLSNRRIAERLVVSVRTVEGHLYRACGKLGVHDRGQLAPLLGVDPGPTGFE